MSSKKIYRIEQMEMKGIVNDLVLMAAMSNGRKRYIPLQYMADYVEMERLKYPVLTEGVKATISENTLLIDETKGDKTINLLAITEVEIMELVDEPCPTLNRYANTGIANSDNQELLN